MNGEQSHGSGENMTTYKAKTIQQHILRCISNRGPHARTLIVGMQGPQGSGKTTITDHVQKLLYDEGKTSAVFSLDDLYLPHSGLKQLEKDHPSNALLHGRGQPGTHDMPLGSTLLTEIIEKPSGSIVHLPIFDKSQFSGEGDRSNQTIEVKTPLDVVLFEGWCLGFYPLEDSELEKKYEEAKQLQVKPYFLSYTLENLKEINNFLKGYLDWYKNIEAFVQLQPDNLHNVFDWRLQAEHAMKAQGKHGMTDEEVKSFVTRYMPGYELFGEGVTNRKAPWSGNGLRLDLNMARDAVGLGAF